MTDGVGINISRKINAILIKAEINLPKLANICADVNWQHLDNMSWKYTWLKITLRTVFFFGGGTFLTHTVCEVTGSHKDKTAYA